MRGLFLSMLFCVLAIGSIGASAPEGVLDVGEMASSYNNGRPSKVYQSRLVLPGVACRSQWQSDVTVIGDSTLFPGPQQIALTYYAREYGNLAYSVTLTVQGGDRQWSLGYDDLICDVFGLLGNTSGTLVVETPWSAKAYARTASNGYGSLVPQSNSVAGWGNITVPDFDTTKYRVNLLFFLDEPVGTVVVVGPDQMFLPPRETVMLLDAEPGTVIIVDDRAIDVHLTVSQIDEATNDPTNIPFWLLAE